MNTSCRLLLDVVAAGPWQMAADEALLHSAVTHGHAALRFYQWSEPTLSLGYFQPHVERLEKVAWLRRPTGGAAILHHHEWTYALALPSGAPWHDGESWLCRMHHAIQRALQQWNIASHAVVCGEEKKLGPVLCFLHQTPGDVLVNGHKVVGSAQRRPHGALLQHGSILVQQSVHTPQLPGLRELTGVTLDMQDFRRAILGEFMKEVGQPVTTSGWSEEEMCLIDELQRTKYTTAEWNEKR